MKKPVRKVYGILLQNWQPTVPALIFHRFLYYSWLNGEHAAKNRILSHHHKKCRFSLQKLLLPVPVLIFRRFAYYSWPNGAHSAKNRISSHLHKTYRFFPRKQLSLLPVSIFYRFLYRNWVRTGLFVQQSESLVHFYQERHLLPNSVASAVSWLRAFPDQRSLYQRWPAFLSVWHLSSHLIGGQTLGQKLEYHFDPYSRQSFVCLFLQP